MTRNDVLRKVKEATEALQNYREGNIERALGESVESLNSDIQIASEQFVSEANAIGAAGRSCPTCGGSGRA